MGNQDRVGCDTNFQPLAGKQDIGVDKDHGPDEAENLKGLSFQGEARSADIKRLVGYL